jgi:DNA-directed RNA polymerase omega subunit
MSMIDPPIDKLIKKAECRYALTCAVAKRTRELLTQESSYLANSGEKPVTLACKEVYSGKLKIVRD